MGHYAFAAAGSIDTTIFGAGGHGGRPQSTIDPVVIAARTVLGLQTIVSRENNPLDPVVITVGTIHGGTKNSIIPEVNGQSGNHARPEVRFWEVLFPRLPAARSSSTGIVASTWHG